MKQVKAYCPAALSFLFRVWSHDNPTKTGSTGVGCTVNKGVTATTTKSDQTRVYFNNQSISIAPVNYVLRQFAPQPVELHFISELPLGVGFGLSGATALTTAFTINELFSLAKAPSELARLAHIAEVISHTGLGTVGTQTTGGFLIKTAPGLPVQANRLDLVGQTLYCLVFDQLSTATLLTHSLSVNRINKTADQLLPYINSSATLPEIMQSSYAFAKKSGLLTDPRVIQAIKSVQKAGGTATMHMVGQAIISTTKKGLENHPNVIEFKIVQEKVHKL